MMISIYDFKIHFVFSGLFLTMKTLFSGMQSDHAILINPEGELIRFGIMSTDTLRLNTAGKLITKSNANWDFRKIGNGFKFIFSGHDVLEPNR